MRARAGFGCALSIERLEGSRLRVRQMRGYANSNGESVGLRGWRGCAGERAHEPVPAEIGLRQTNVTKDVVEEVERRNWIVGETKGYRVCRNLRNSLAGENVFMLQRQPPVESEIAFLLR